MRCLLSLLLMGCNIPEGPEPCDLDPSSCRRTRGFYIDPACTLSSELVVEAGEGYDAFEAVGSALEIQTGVQGGSHFFGAVRVGQAALDRYEVLEVTFSLTTPGEDEPHTDRTVVLGDFEPIEVDDEGRVVAYGYLVEVTTGFARDDLYSVSVRDPCGRKGSDTVTLR